MEKRKKVLYLITKSEPFGGAQWYVYNLATRVPKERFEAVVAAGGAGPLFEKLRADGIRTIPIPSLGREVNPLADVSAFFQILAIIRRERPDVLHLNSSKIGGLGALAGRLAGVRRIVFTAHGWEFNAPRPRLQRVIIKFFSWLAVVLTHETIAISEAMRGEFPSVRRIRVIHNGIDPVQALPRDEVRQFLAEKGVADSIIVGTIAELTPVKGLTSAIEAIALLRDKGHAASLVVFGEGTQRAELEQLIRTRGLEKVVTLLGYVPDGPTYLSGFDIFVLPSVYEGLSFALLSAGSVGLPVVASRVGGIPEVVEDGKSGILVPPGDSNALASAIESLLTNPEKKAAYGEALQERVQTKFLNTAMLEKTFALY